MFQAKAIFKFFTLQNYKKPCHQGRLFYTPTAILELFYSHTNVPFPLFRHEGPNHRSRLTSWVETTKNRSDFQLPSDVHWFPTTWVETTKNLSGIPPPGDVHWFWNRPFKHQKKYGSQIVKPRVRGRVRGCY